MYKFFRNIFGYFDDYINVSDYDVETQSGEHSFVFNLHLNKESKTNTINYLNYASFLTIFHQLY